MDVEDLELRAKKLQKALPVLDRLVGVNDPLKVLETLAEHDDLVFLFQEAIIHQFTVQDVVREIIANVIENIDECRDEILSQREEI